LGRDRYIYIVINNKEKKVLISIHISAEYTPNRVWTLNLNPSYAPVNFKSNISLMKWKKGEEKINICSRALLIATGVKGL